MYSSIHTAQYRKNCTISHTKKKRDCASGQLQRLLVTDKGRSPLWSANHCQGQLQTPQSQCVSCTMGLTLLIRKKGVRRMWHRVVPKLASFIFSLPDPSYRQCVFAVHKLSNRYRTLPDRPTVHNTRFPTTQIQTLGYVLSQCLFLSIPLAILQM